MSHWEEDNNKSMRRPYQCDSQRPVERLPGSTKNSRTEIYTVKSLGELGCVRSLRHENTVQCYKCCSGLALAEADVSLKRSDTGICPHKRGRSECLAQRSRASGRDEDRGVGQLGGLGRCCRPSRVLRAVRLRILLKRRRVGSEPRRASPVPGSELSMPP